MSIIINYRDSEVEALLALLVGDVNIHAVQARLERGLGEALHAEHRTVLAAEHRQLLPVARTLL